MKQVAKYHTYFKYQQDYTQNEHGKYLHMLLEEK
jgi:hypothetical protein